MNKQDKKLLGQFQCEYNRTVEENFAQILAERSDLRLFFINENRAFTDGRNIIVDPAIRELFADIEAVRATEEYLSLDNIISGDKWLALRMVTRSLNIHETLHILYSDFPGGVATDPRGSSQVRKHVLALISNIIEDAFIEAAGCSIYDNLECYLLWMRVAFCCSNIPAESTIQRAFSEAKETDNPQTEEPSIIEYLEYMACRLLYPMVTQPAPSESIAEYISNTSELFDKGAVIGDPKRRYEMVQQIFDIIEPLIPANQTLDATRLERMLFGMQTHNYESSSIQNTKSDGKIIDITRRLFFDLDGKPIDRSGINGQLSKELARFVIEKEAALKILTNQGNVVNWGGKDYDCAVIHKDIKIEVTKPPINFNMKKAYQNIYNHYRLTVNSYNARFHQMLKGFVDSKEDRQLFGSGISSKHFGDVKKRYWFRTVDGVDVPDIALLFLIDGSGSMEGLLREGAIISSVILHEVLTKNNIEHAIIEHRAIYDKPLVQHKILTDFSAKPEEKYNLMMLQAEEGTREGLSLYWAERYLQQNSCAENKIIIAISDGVPAHGLDNDSCYLPPASIKDTYNAVRKIIKRGTKVLAVALDAPGETFCYEALKEIYPSVVSCTELKRLAPQLLRLVSMELT